MNRNANLAIIVATVLIAAAAFLIARPDDDTGSRTVAATSTAAPPPARSGAGTTSATTPTEPEQTATATTTPTGTTTTTRTKPRRLPPQRQPAPVKAPATPEEITVRGGRPVGGPKTIRAGQGDVVRFNVISDSDHEIHLHGYDVKRAASARRPARFLIPARLEGIFEIELHGDQTLIGRLVVEP